MAARYVGTGPTHFTGCQLSVDRQRLRSDLGEEAPPLPVA